MDDLSELYGKIEKSISSDNTSTIRSLKLVHYVTPEAVVAVIQGIKLLSDILSNAKEITTKDKLSEKLDEIIHKIDEVKWLEHFQNESR